jgi:HPt (histidine-containing phosphotransfer) domain-containing protein
MSSLNWDKEFALEQAADDAELLQELLDIFKDSCKKDLALINEGISENDPKKVCGAAHSIKGAAASLGILGIRDVALIMETDSRGGGLTLAREKSSTLQALLDEMTKL